jgi:hypothetical protein
VAQMADNANGSGEGLRLHELEEVGSVVVGRDGVIQVVMFLLFFVYDGSFKGLTIFLLDHYLGLRIHLLMRRIVFFIFMQYNPMLI